MATRWSEINHKSPAEKVEAIRRDAHAEAERIVKNAEASESSRDGGKLSKKNEAA